MDNLPKQPPSQLFTLRLWQAQVSEGQAEWRGQLQHVLSGEMRYFRDWPALVLYLRDLLSEIEPNPSDSDASG